MRGAVGNVRATNAVRLEDEGDGTLVVLEADVALGGMLGAVGQKVFARQAAAAAKDFAGQLEREGTGGSRCLRACCAAPEPASLPAGRDFSAEFLDLRRQAQVWIRPYYDGEHLARAGDWMLALAPQAPEPLAIAALLHDMERSVPGGPTLDKVNQAWDDAGYNGAHCERSAEVVAAWLAERGASQAFVEGVQQPIREHEFGGSPAGDLMQAADSISFLEVNGPLVARWVAPASAASEKAARKLEWMAGRRAPRAGAGDGPPRSSRSSWPSRPGRLQPASA